MRRALLLAIVLGLVVGSMAAPASAGKKKGKGKKPVTFEASGAFALGNPGDLNDAGVVRQEFLASCAIPASQGLDGYVIELSEEIGKVTSDISVIGTDAAGLHDLDMYLYDESCAPMGSFATVSADEFGQMSPGTKFVLVTAFTGVELSFNFEAVQVK